MGDEELTMSISVDWSGESKGRSRNMKRVKEVGHAVNQPWVVELKSSVPVRRHSGVCVLMVSNYNQNYERSSRIRQALSRTQMENWAVNWNHVKTKTCSVHVCTAIPLRSDMRPSTITFTGAFCKDVLRHGMRLKPSARTLLCKPNASACKPNDSDIGCSFRAKLLDLLTHSG